ncbi:MAG: hydrogenase maturation nickel metallochaperone HypA [Actinomycetota bacterium]|nr:hydrogenase maturation nickel metallochaperone HypA [Actinomycetota bacterium]
MHELSLASAIVDTAVKHAGGRRVKAVNLKVGRLRQVVPDSLDFYFGLVAADTLCEGALLDQSAVEASLRCPSCDVRWTLEEPLFRCPSCGSREVEVVSGNEFEIDSIVLEDREQSCTR